MPVTVDVDTELFGMYSVQKSSSRARQPLSRVNLTVSTVA